MFLPEADQDLAPRFPDTRSPIRGGKPKTNELRYCCSAGATFSERSIGKSLVPLLLFLPVYPGWGKVDNRSNQGGVR